MKKNRILHSYALSKNTVYQKAYQAICHLDERVQKRRSTGLDEDAANNSRKSITSWALGSNNLNNGAKKDKAVVDV